MLSSDRKVTVSGKKREMTYSIDLRKKVMEIKEREGLSVRETARRFGVGKQTIYRWSKRLKPKRSRNKGTIKIDMEELKKDIKKYPDSYERERAERLGVSKSGIHWAIHRLGVSYKKNYESSEGGWRRTTYHP